MECEVKWAIESITKNKASAGDGIPVELFHQPPLSMEFSKLEYYCGLPFSSPGTLITQGLNLSLLHCRQIRYYMIHEGSTPTIEIQG